MVSIVEMFREGGIFSWLQLLLAVVAAPWALLCAVLLALRWKVPPVLSLAPLLLVPVLVAGGATWSYGQVASAVAAVDPAQRATLMAQGVAEGLTQGVLGVLSAPTAFLLGMGGLIAGIRAPRAWGGPVVVLLVAGFTSLLPLAQLFALHGEFVPVLVRVLPYAVCVLPLALATANAHPHRNGAEGGMTAAAAWISWVGASELAGLTYEWQRVFRALAMVDPESRGALINKAVEEMGSAQTLAWVTFALAAIPALICAFRSGPQLTVDEVMSGPVTPSPWRSLARVAALLAWPLWAIAIASVNPADVLEQIGHLK